MAQKFLTGIEAYAGVDLKKTELKNAAIQNLAAAPSSPVKGQIYFNTVDNKLYVYDGTIWEPIDGDIQSITAGDGLSGSATSGDVTLDINVDDSTIEINSDTLRVKAGGIGANELAATTVTAGDYGDSTHIATFTVDADGRLTAAGEAEISTTLSISGDTGTDTVSLIDGTLNFEGGDGITTVASDDNIKIDVDSTVVRTSGTQTIEGNKTFADNVIINGDLTVSGATTTKISETVLIEDNIITLNSNETASPTENSGIEVERGTATNVSLIWNESDDRWKFTNDGSTFYNILTPSEIESAGKITKKISGDGSTTSFTANHGFGTPIVSVQVLDYGNDGTGATYEVVYTDVQRSSDNAVTIGFAAAPLSTQDYLVLISKFPAIS